MQFTGILLGVYRVADVVEEALQDLNLETGFELCAQNAVLEEQFLGGYDAGNGVVRSVASDRPLTNDRQSRLCAQPSMYTRSLEIGQRPWLVTFCLLQVIP